MCWGVGKGEARWGSVEKCGGGVGKCVGVSREVKNMYGEVCRGSGKGAGKGGGKL